MGGQFGGGFGAGFSQGVEDEIEFERKRQLEKEKREYEEEVRAEARGFSTSERIAQQDFSAGQTDLVRADRMLERDVARIDKKDARTQDVSDAFLAQTAQWENDKKILEESRGYARTLEDEELATSRAEGAQLFATRIESAFGQKRTRDGENASPNQEDFRRLEEQVTAAYTPDMTLDQVSDLMFSAEKQAKEIGERHDLEELEAAILYYTAPDEDGNPRATEPEIARLEALLQTNDPVQVGMGVVTMLDARERRANREAGFEGAAARVGGALEMWEATPPPDSIAKYGDPSNPDEYSNWKSEVSGRAAAAVTREVEMRAIMGENYDHISGEARVMDVLNEMPPSEMRRADAQRLARESGAAEAVAEREARWGMVASAETAGEAQSAFEAAKRGPEGQGEETLVPKPKDPLGMPNWYMEEAGAWGTKALAAEEAGDTELQAEYEQKADSLLTEYERLVAQMENDDKDKTPE